MTNGSEKAVYCLSFKFDMNHPTDKIYFAPTIPYLYSTLINHIEKIKVIQSINGFRVFESSTLCKTLGGVEVPLLKITNFDSEEIWEYSSHQKTKKFLNFKDFR